MADINIREVKKTDAKKIYELMQQQVAEQNTVLSPYLTCEAMAEDGWGLAAGVVVFIAEHMGAKEGELEGYILGNRAYTPWLGRALYIKDVYVVPAARRSGVAMHLCRRLLQAALSMGCNQCDVWIDKTNKACVGLIEKLGAQNITEAEDWHLFSLDSKVVTEMKARCEGQGLLKVRPATPEDMVDVMAMIQELADYEKMPDAPKINTQTLVTDSPPQGLFFECLVAESDGTLVGYVMFYPTFSCQGPGMCLEDFYVRSTHRCQGLGTALITQAAKRGLTQGASHLELYVLSWNTPSISYYQQRGGTDLTAGSGVQVYRFYAPDMRKCVQ